MKILIVSGFLGAGKTTFIKELIRRSGVHPVVMENEYGDNNIDASELQQTSSTEMKILEFMEGCVCCTMKDSFVNSILAVSASLDPEYLIVEPTGVGRLSSILANLKPVLYDKISLIKPVTVLSPEHCRRNAAEWKDLYTDQIKSAGKIIFSKCEQTSREILDDAVKVIRELNPDAEIISQHYTAMPDEWWRSVLEVPDEGGQAEPDASGFVPLVGTSVTQLTVNHSSMESPAHLVLFLEDCLHGEMGHLARAKGTMPVGREMIRFDLADGLYALSGSPDTKSQCVFIGQDLQKSLICKRLGTTLSAEGADEKKPFRKQYNKDNTTLSFSN